MRAECWSTVCCCCANSSVAMRACMLCYTDHAPCSALQLATGSYGWRSGASKIIVWFGDAPGEQAAGQTVVFVTLMLPSRPLMFLPSLNAAELHA